MHRYIWFVVAAAGVSASCGLRRISAQRDYAVVATGCVVDSASGSPMPVSVWAPNARNMSEMVWENGRRTDPDSAGFFRVRAVLPVGPQRLQVYLQKGKERVLLRPEIPLNVQRDATVDLGVLRLTAERDIGTYAPLVAAIDSQTSPQRSTLAATCELARAIARGSTRPKQPGSVLRADSSFFASVRVVITDSITGAGTAPAQLLRSRDGRTTDFLKRTGVAFQPWRPGDLPCPGGSNADGTPIAPPVGYVVRVKAEPTWDGEGWLVDIDKSCRFIYRGKESTMGGFGEGARFEFRQIDGRWRLVRTVSHFIT